MSPKSPVSRFLDIIAITKQKKQATSMQTNTAVVPAPIEVSPALTEVHHASMEPKAAS